MKTITLHSLSTPDNPEIGYGDYVDVREDGLVLWGSHASCCPNPYKLNGQGLPIPWKLVYDWVAYGEYKWECVDHYKYGKCLLINGGGEVASRNPVKNKDGSTFKGVFIHTGAFKSQNPKWRGSQGCITIPPDLWQDFIEVFTVGEKGILHVKPLIEDKKWHAKNILGWLKGWLLWKLKSETTRNLLRIYMTTTRTQRKSCQK